MSDGTTTARAQIDAVLDLANQALAEVERDLKHLLERQTQLREFIRLGDAMLAGEAFGVARPPTLAPVPQTAARQAEDLLHEVGRPMRIVEMYRRIEARGTLTGRQPKDALRTALRDRPDLFRRLGRGVYGLVAWSQPPMAVG
jgi:hypothetical protein